MKDVVRGIKSVLLYALFVPVSSVVLYFAAALFGIIVLGPFFGIKIGVAFGVSFGGMGITVALQLRDLDSKSRRDLSRRESALEWGIEFLGLLLAYVFMVLGMISGLWKYYAVAMILYAIGMYKDFLKIYKEIY